VQKFAKLSIILPEIARFRSNFVQTLITWCLMYHRLSRSMGQRSRSQRVITYQHKNAIIHARISYRRSNLVKLIPEQSATRYMTFKVIRSNIEIAITLPRIVRLRSNLVQSFITSQAIHCKCSVSNLKCQGHSVK